MRVRAHTPGAPTMTMVVAPLVVTLNTSGQP
jgi:hypothetical protein